MNIIDLRKNLRDSPNNQRVSDRRKNPHPFGSPEWLDYIRSNGLEPPAHDRRTGPRRASDRRRQQMQAERTARPYTRILLTAAEKKLLADMYLADFDGS